MHMKQWNLVHLLMYKRDELANFGIALGDEWLVVDDNIITPRAQRQRQTWLFNYYKC